MLCARSYQISLALPRPHAHQYLGVTKESDAGTFRSGQSSRGVGAGAYKPQLMLLVNDALSVTTKIAKFNNSNEKKHLWLSDCGRAKKLVIMDHDV